ncbi:MAG: cation transporter [Herpetosiphonaceae bacterium]|nr:cation transporter [Herpetosiphonaceae bacterium]
MSHHHDHGTNTYGRAFAIGIGLNLAYVIVEFLYGRTAHSLALVADAGHNLSDVLGLVLAWGASLLAQRQPSQRRTYGLRRSSILAALINAVVLLLSIGAIGWEALQRLNATTPVASQTVIIVAAAGIVINALTAALFMAGRHGDLNIRGAFLHMAADAGIALGVVLAGVVMLATGWLWLDPVVSLLIVAVILGGTWGLLRDAVNLALDGVPVGIEVAAVKGYLRSLPGVLDVHDMHIWAMSTTETALTAHLMIQPEVPRGDGLLVAATQALHDRFGIEHATLQVETCELDRHCACSLGSGEKA